MTDTKRPEWMPSRESLLSLAHNETLYADCGHYYAGEELEEMVRCATIRAQIEVLEEEDAHMVAFLGGTYTDENREWRQEKIAALRKELGS